MGQIKVTQYRDKWRAFVSKAMNIQAPRNARKVLSRYATGIFS